MVSYRAPVSTLVATRLTPGMTAPDGSDTVPVIVPRSLCAKAERETTTKQNRTLNEPISILLQRRESGILSNLWRSCFCDVGGSLCTPTFDVKQCYGNRLSGARRGWPVGA